MSVKHQQVIIAYCTNHRSWDRTSSLCLSYFRKHHFFSIGDKNLYRVHYLRICTPNLFQGNHSYNIFAYSEPYQTSQIECFTKYLTAKSHQLFSKALHLRCLTGFWIHLRHELLLQWRTKWKNDLQKNCMWSILCKCCVEILVEKFSPIMLTKSCWKLIGGSVFLETFKKR